MKANVLPVTTAEPLQVPSWVPEPVAQVAREAYTVGDDSARKVIARLTCDPRMRGVWRELLRRRRDGTFMYPSISFTLHLPSFMRLILQDALRPGRTLSRQQAKQERSRLLDMAERLRSEMTTEPEDVLRLTAAAETYEQLASNIEHHLQTREGPVPEVLDLDRVHGDPTERWLAFAISWQCRIMFASPLYGITAIIVSVALGREITPRAVRQMVLPYEELQRHYYEELQRPPCG
jgi:hypothetical protein